MHLGRHSVSSVPIGTFNQITINQQSDTFALATNQGFQIWNLHPLQLLADRQLPGSIGHASLLHRTSLVFLLGGGSNPLYPLNKLIIWDDRFQTPVLELEFREKILGVASRRGLLALSFLKRVVLLTIDGFGEEDNVETKRHKRRGKERETIKESQILQAGGTDGQKESIGGLKWLAEWETCENPRGLLALSTSPSSTLLAIPGRQPGHVHLLHLPPCPSSLSSDSPLSTSPPSSLPPPSKSALLIAHTHPLSTLSCPPSGRFFSTSSERGTLIRVWDGRSGGLVKELRRGADQAVVWGVGWLPPPPSSEDKDGDGKEGVIVWSDKGTIHVFTLEEGGKDSDRGQPRNPKSPFQTLQPYLPISLPKYFLSEWSHAQFRLPTRTPHAETLTHLNPSSPSSDLHSISSSSASTPATQSANSIRSGSSGAALEDRCLVSWVRVPIRTPYSTDKYNISATQPRTMSSSSLSFKACSSTSEALPPHEMEYQLVALTYTGGYYRITLPSSSSSSSTPSSYEGSASSLHPSSTRGIDRSETESTGSGHGAGLNGGGGCKLVEFRRFGQDSDRGFIGGSGRGNWNEREKW